MASKRPMTYGDQNAVMVMAGLMLGLDYGSEQAAAKQLEGSRLHPMQGAEVERSACLVHEHVRTKPDLMGVANTNAECLIRLFGFDAESSGVQGSQLCLRTVAGSDLRLTAVPMSRRPSDVPEDWLRFQGEHVPSLELSDRQVAMLQLFMRAHRTEAVTDGAENYTVAGNTLARCNPQLFQ